MDPENGEGIFVTIQQRLRRSNLIMLIVPAVIAGVLLAVGIGVLALLLQTVWGVGYRLHAV